jgi:hypothetical protein
MDIYVERCEEICTGGGSIRLTGADDGAATVWARYFVIGVVRITWGRRAKDCRPDSMRFGFRHAGAEQTAALGTGGQMRATRRGQAAQDDKDEARAAESDEFIGVAAVLDDGTTERAAGGEVTWHSSWRASARHPKGTRSSG